jgi:type IV secretory pathway TraG/TraD family ATPase VirD4
MAGYNIRLLPIIQSMAQIDATYADAYHTIITNHALQIIMRIACSSTQRLTTIEEVRNYFVCSSGQVAR